MDNMKTMMRGNHDKADADELHQQLQGLHVNAGDDLLLWALYRQFNTFSFSILKLVVGQLVRLKLGQCVKNLLVVEGLCHPYHLLSKAVAFCPQCIAPVDKRTSGWKHLYKDVKQDP